MKKTKVLTRLGAIALVAASQSLAAQSVFQQQNGSITNLSYSVIDLTPDDGQAASVTFGSASPSLGQLSAQIVENYAQTSVASGTITRLPFSTQNNTITLPSGLAQASSGSNGDLFASSQLTFEALDYTIDKARLSPDSAASYLVTADASNIPNLYNIDLARDYNFVLAPHTTLVLQGRMTLETQGRPTAANAQSLLDLATRKDARILVSGGQLINVSLTLDQEPEQPWMQAEPLTELASIAWQSFYYVDPSGFDYIDDPQSFPIDQTFSISISNTTNQTRIGLLNYSVGGASSLEAFALPEPATWASFALGLGFLGAAVARRRNHAV